MDQIERVFVRFRGRTIGPFTPDKLRDMVRRGQVTRMHELSGDGLSWMKADEFGNFFPQQTSYSADLNASASEVPPDGMGGPAKPPANENAQAQWYAHVNGEKQGPVSMDQMRLYHEAKILKKDSLVWRSGMDAWRPAGEVIPEFFGPAPKPSADGGAPDMITSGSTDAGPAGDMGPLASEVTKQHTMVLILGITLVLGGLVFIGAQITKFSSTSGKTLQSDYMGGTMRMALGGVALLAGALALQTSSKLKAASEESMAVATVVAVKSLNQFFIVSGVGMIVWLCVLAIVVLSAIATNVPVLNVLL
ncbi:MAG: DUF4339 domain-containing protein [Planctomycetota bacterium]